MGGWTPTMGSALVSLGLDEQRAQLAVALVGSVVAAAVAGRLGGSIAGWAVGAFWFLVLYLAPSAATGLPGPVRGERLDLPSLINAIGAQFGLAIAASGLGLCVALGLGQEVGRLPEPERAQSAAAAAADRAQTAARRGRRTVALSQCATRPADAARGPSVRGLGRRSQLAAG
jgi:hypothetical protein